MRPTITLIYLQMIMAGLHQHPVNTYWSQCRVCLYGWLARINQLFKHHHLNALELYLSKKGGWLHWCRVTAAWSWDIAGRINGLSTMPACIMCCKKKEKKKSCFRLLNDVLKPEASRMYPGVASEKWQNTNWNLMKNMLQVVHRL